MKDSPDLTDTREATEPGESRQVPAIVVALVAVGGVIWVISAFLYSAVVVSCFSCGSAVVAAGIDTSDFSAGAIRTLAWDALYANLYVATIGLLAVIVGVTAFRRGARWAWIAMAVFALSGLMTAILDELAWGGWFTFLFLGLLPLLGVALAAPAVFGRRTGRA